MSGTRDHKDNIKYSKRSIDDLRHWYKYFPNIKAQLYKIHNVKWEINKQIN